jgi:dTMP kinase
MFKQPLGVRMTRGILITFEGPEGSGKSTQAAALVRFLRRHRVPVVQTHEPGGTAAGRAVRRLLLHTRRTQLATLTEVYLFMASRAQLIDEVIAPALRQGRAVICDRFLDATLAYQGGGGGVSRHLIEALARPALQGVRPQKTFLLDIDTRAGFRRVGAQRDRMESKSRTFHERVRRAYIRLATQAPRRIQRIEANRPRADVQRDIRHAAVAALRRRYPTLQQVYERGAA